MVVDDRGVGRLERLGAEVPCSGPGQHVARRPGRRRSPDLARSARCHPVAPAGPPRGGAVRARTSVIAPRRPTPVRTAPDRTGAASSSTSTAISRWSAAWVPAGRLAPCQGLCRQRAAHSGQEPAPLGRQRRQVRRVRVQAAQGQAQLFQLALYRRPGVADTEQVPASAPAACAPAQDRRPASSPFSAQRGTSTGPRSIEVSPAPGSGPLRRAPGSSPRPAGPGRTKTGTRTPDGTAAWASRAPSP